MKDFKESYKDVWAKAADNVEAVLADIKPLCEKYLAAYRLGFAALSVREENGTHDKSEPDIFVMVRGVDWAAIEVTGTDRQNWPCSSWIASHKLEYAKRSPIPICYVLCYPNAKRFVTREVALKRSVPYEAEIRGNLEHYNVLAPTDTEEYAYLLVWLEGLLKRAWTEQ